MVLPVSGVSAQLFGRKQCQTSPPSGTRNSVERRRNHRNGSKKPSSRIVIRPMRRINRSGSGGRCAQRLHCRRHRQSIRHHLIPGQTVSQPGSIVNGKSFGEIALKSTRKEPCTVILVSLLWTMTFRLTISVNHGHIVLETMNAA